MANFTVSPGAKLNEIDNTFLTSQPIQAGAAIIGPTVKGPVLIPTKVTSYSEYTTMFGDVVESGSRNYSYLTSIAAYNYFNYGGTSLLVTRVVTGSYTSATSSITNEDATTPFVLETIGEGDLMNTGTDGTGGALSTGTKNNVRWQISSPNTASGTFNLLVRRGDDINNKTIVLESFNGVNLDPNSNKYIAKVIGDQKQNYDSVNNQLTTTGSYVNASRFVRVKSVNTPTLNYLDPNGVAKDQYTGSIPLVSTGSFNGAEGTPFPARAGQFYQDIDATDSQGLTGDNYTTAISLLSNSETYQFNVLFTPGLTDEAHDTQITNIITNTQNRGDNLFVFDTTNYGSTITTAIGEANNRDTSYAATYWPWVRISDPATGKLVFIPASTMIPGVYAFNDKVAAPWFAPAGINRGGLSTVVSTEYKLSQGNRDSLYESNINPLATLPRTGVVVYGQKTLQKQASALDRVNVRRLLIELKNYISQIAETVVFEQNTIVTRGSFLARINPYLEGIQQKQGLYAFQVKMDDSNNGPDVIDRNQLIGQIYVQPTRTAEFISLDFILQPTGAEFPG
jgi:phage tail sheath protein FI